MLLIISNRDKKKVVTSMSASVPGSVADALNFEVPNDAWRKSTSHRYGVNAWSKPIFWSSRFRCY